LGFVRVGDVFEIEVMVVRIGCCSRELEFEVWVVCCGCSDFGELCVEVFDLFFVVM